MRQEKSRSSPVVHSDPETLSGTPVFLGTRVPFRSLIDYLEQGPPLAEFLDDFPAVTREQYVAALEETRGLLEAWKEEYSNDRPDGSLRHMPPARYRAGGVPAQDRDERETRRSAGPESG